ncbi:MAG: hypothetical protein ACLU38_07125 [Dysosmobacter sp.]
MSVPAEKTTCRNLLPPFVPAIPPERLDCYRRIYRPDDCSETRGTLADCRRGAADLYHLQSEDGSVWLIDKHAAHERMNFDRLMTCSGAPHAADPC